jgi:hypothetical protein
MTSPFKKPARELRRGDVILAVNDDARFPTLVVLRVRDGTPLVTFDAWNVNAWCAQSHGLPAGAMCTIEGQDRPEPPTATELARALRELHAAHGSRVEWVEKMLDLSRRTGVLP